MANSGFSDKVKGETKDQIGNATNSASLQVEGKFDKLEGEVQKKVGELKDKLIDKVEK